MVNVLADRQRSALSRLADAESLINELILGKQEVVRLCLTCILARGHLLIEDHPGVGKTTLAHSLARVLGLAFNRIQFTSDMLPADVIGVSVYDSERAGFKFHQGPLFKEVVLADEINRASPRAQSALLEAMEEHQVSVDGHSYDLPTPFFVIATQNPHEQSGTFPLPESQLDRFMMTLSIGFPSRVFEQALLKGDDRTTLLRELEAVLDANEVIELQRQAEGVFASDALTGYVLDLVEASRNLTWIDNGLSPRAGLALLRAARAFTLLDNRDAVLPEDVQAVAPAIIGHRLAQGLASAERDALTRRLIESVAVD